MNERDTIRAQVEHAAAAISARMERIHDALHELKRMALFVFHETCSTSNHIDAWLASAGYAVDEDGFYQSIPLLEAHRAHRANPDAISTTWDARIASHPGARFRMYALRNIGPHLAQIRERLQDVSWLYYQDASNTALQFPFIDQRTAISHDFDWTTYHTWRSVCPANNPSRAIQWTPPTIDYAGEGLIVSASIPVYDDDEFIGVWSVDVPTSSLCSSASGSAALPSQRSFIIDREGYLIAHDNILITPPLHPEKGAVLRTHLSSLGTEFASLQLNLMLQQGKGEITTHSKDGRPFIFIFEAIPRLDWLVLSQFAAEELSEAFSKTLQRAIQRVKEGDLSHRLDPPFGDNSIDLLITSFNEMTLTLEQKQQEARHAALALRESEDRYRRLVELSPYLVAIHCDGTVVFINEAGCRLLGASDPDEIVGLPVLDLVAPEDHERVLKRTELVSTTGQESTLQDEKLIRLDGTVIDVESTATPFDYNGRPAVQVIAREITARKLLEDQLRQAQKMEAIGQLAGGIAHDFNNLLQGILGYADMAQQSLPPDHPCSADLLEIRKAATRASNLTQQLLAFSRRQVLQPKDIELNDVINDSMRMLRRVIPENVIVDFTPGHRVGRVHADPGQIAQILMNLAINARDAMPDGGRITIETQNVLINGDYCETHAWAVRGRYVLLTFSDTGCGIDENTQKHIFEPFFTTKEVGKGTGLGLATVYGIVKQHEGMISVYSEIDIGTIFKIYLPLVERSATAVGTSIEGPVVGGTETILLAEDDDTVRGLAKRILESAGYTVITAQDGLQAIQAAQEHLGPISLAVLDVVMPGLGGRQTYERIHQSRPEIRALFTSGYSLNGVHTSFVLEEGLRLIPKPYGPDTLLRGVREALDNPPDDQAK